MQGSRAPPRGKAPLRVRSLTRATEIKAGDVPDCWYWGLDEVSEILFSLLPILMKYITRS